jgi:hypothetical protein
MNLLAATIRLTLQRALLGQTLAEGSVHDSRVVVAGEEIFKDPRPFIVVSTEAETTNVTGLDFAGADREIVLLIEIGLAGRLNRDGVDIPDTEEGMEFSLDILARQVMRVVQAGQDPWAQRFRTFAGAATKTEALRVVHEGRKKLAARQIAITLKPTFSEPVFGQAATGEWAALIAAMKGDEILGQFGVVLEEELIGAVAPDWLRLQQLLGLTDSRAAALGVGPLVPGEEPEEAGKFTGDGVSTPFVVEAPAP